MKKDWFLFLDVLLIIATGLATLYSTVSGSEEILGGGVFNRQLLYVLIAVAVYFAVSYFDYRFLGNAAVIVPMIGIIALLLVYVLIFGVEINNAKRWIIVAGIQVQPSEFAKLALLIATSWIFSLRLKKKLWKLALLSTGLAILFSLLIFFEPDAGTTIVMLGIWGMAVFSMIPNQLFNAGILFTILTSAIGLIGFVSGNTNVGIIGCSTAIIGVGLTFLLSKRLKIVPFIALIAGIGIGFAGLYVWNSVFHDYQRERIESYINPSGKSLDEAFQVEQSKVAIGSGMIWGKGYGLGTQSKLQFLPEHQTDFIFATYAEEFGFFGSLILLILYAVLIVRILRASVKITNPFGSMLCLSIGTKLLIEIYINIGMNMGLVPATGVPLPLMSAGGSILLVTMIGLGLVQSSLMHTDDV